MPAHILRRKLIFRYARSNQSVYELNGNDNGFWVPVSRQGFVSGPSHFMKIDDLAHALLYEGSPMRGSAMRVSYALNPGDKIEVRMVWGKSRKTKKGRAR
jgi:hypothetical protein